MSKKSRRTKAKRRSGSAKLVQRQSPQRSELATAEPRASVGVSHGLQDFTARYQYVIPELKHIGIFAGAIILVLIVLSFVI